MTHFKKTLKTIYFQKLKIQAKCFEVNKISFPNEAIKDTSKNE